MTSTNPSLDREWGIVERTLTGGALFGWLPDRTGSHRYRDHLFALPSNPWERQHDDQAYVGRHRRHPWAARPCTRHEAGKVCASCMDLDLATDAEVSEFVAEQRAAVAS